MKVGGDLRCRRQHHSQELVALRTLFRSGIPKKSLRRVRREFTFFDAMKRELPGKCLEALAVHDIDRGKGCLQH